MKLFTEKHKPLHRKDMIGDQGVFSLIHAYLAGKPLAGRKKALWLVGPPGTGKTLAVHAISRELGLELVEINASDVRNTGAIESVVGNAIKQQSLFSSGKAILIDEVDGLSGQADRGGVGAIASIISESTFPIIITSFDAEEHKLSPIKKLCQIIGFEPHSASATQALLALVAKAEGIALTSEALSLLSRKAAGDLRAALNDLQALAHTAGAKTPVGVQELDVLGDRRRIETMQQALFKIFKTTDPNVALATFDNVDEDIDELFLWIDENIPLEYKKTEDLSRAFLMLSLADVFFGRIRRWQYYRFYVYCYDFLSAGIALAKEKRYPAPTAYRRTERLLKIWIANQQNAKRKSVAGKLAPHLHAGSKRLVKEMPYLRIIARQDGAGAAASWKDRYKLDDDDVEWLAR